MIPFYQGITDFIFMEDKPEKADLILITGGNYPEAAREAARLYQEGYAPRILPSGRYSIVDGSFAGEQETEWEYLRDILCENGVPEEAIMKEDQATFTYENAIFSRQVVNDAGLQVKKAILCCQAWHSRRAYMYYQQQFPDTQLMVCPVVTKGISRDNWFLSQEKTDVILGEIARIGDQFHCVLPLKQDIRLIASDVDGTMVPEGTSGLNPEVYEVIRKLYAKGIRFAACSGRGHDSLANLFGPVQDIVYLVAENGGYITLGDQLLHEVCYEEELKREIIAWMRGAANTKLIMVSTAVGAFTEGADQTFIEQMEQGYGITLGPVRDLLRVGTPAMKIAVYSATDAAEMAEEAKRYFGDRVTITASGAHWVDFVPPNVDKGSGLEWLMKELQVTREQTIAFGDNDNDISMLLAAGTGCAVSEARPGAIAAADRIIGSNREESVLKELKRILKDAE